jgi:hypothetical protein
MSRLRSRVALFGATTLATTLAATVAVTSFTLGSPPASAVPSMHSLNTSSASAAQLKGVEIRGAVGERGPISRAELADFDEVTFAFSYQTSGGPQTHRYSGPLLLDVLNSVEPNFSSDPHDNLRYAILVKASDGYLAALAWGEIAPDLADKRAILALTEDGKTLARPRLVLPGDSHGARQVFDVATIFLLRLSPELAKGEAGRILSGVPGHEHH